VLGYVVEHPGQLITKEELLNAVWPDTFVGDAVLKVTVRQIREALGDDPKSPRFIETAHRRGYRFIGQLAERAETSARAPESRGIDFASASLPGAADSSSRVVGRGDALSQMQSCLKKMFAGERQILFVTGEAGIGKTAMVDMFARSLTSDGSIRIGRGQCLEQYGTSEAYMPVLEAIGRLCREQAQVIEVLRDHAPMWLLQMPSLLSAPERESLSREVIGASRERMLREMGETLEALSAEFPLVLILEDLHWSDYSTLDLISYLARQRGPAQLMLIGTYRPVELIVSGHPLKAVKQELLAKQQCRELPLEYLGEEAVNNYLSARFSGKRFPTELAGLIHERTEGNPLFMINVVDYLVAEGLLVETEERWELAVEIERVELGVPDSVKQMIEKQINHLDAEEQRALEAASVAGAEFSPPAVAAGLGHERASVEARCDELARRRQFIQDCGIQVLPNGEAVSQYGFIHALYRKVLYDRVSASRRIQLHRRIGEQVEALYADGASAIAAELAMHFERGADHKRAAKYLQQAADNALRRFAYQEAIALSRRGLELLLKLPDTPERARQELCLQLTLGVPLISTDGYAAPEVGSVYIRARELCQQLGETPDVSEALWGLWTFYTLSAELAIAREIAEELLHLSERLPYPGMALRGHWAIEITCTHLGEFATAIEHYEKALQLYAPERHLEDGFFYALNPGVPMPCFAAWSLWCLGQPDKALDRIQEALRLARHLSEPLSLAHALLFAAILHQLRREDELAQQHADAAFSVSTEHGLALYQAMAIIIQGWALLRHGRTKEAIEQIRRGLAEVQATGTVLVRPHFLGLLAEALGHARQPEEGLRALEEAIHVAERGGERYYEAELYRLKGELLLMQAGSPGASRASDGGKAAAEKSLLSEAEGCFSQAIEIARRQKAKSWELRAGLSLARLYQKRGRQADARDILTQSYGNFTEGFYTADLLEAKALLDQSP
jgi:predicted ATPase